MSEIDLRKKNTLAALKQDLGGLRKLEEKAGRPLQRATIPGTVYLLVDISGSMEESLPSAKQGALEFAQTAQAKGHAVGLIGFGSSAIHYKEPQRHLEPLRPAIQSLAISGSTNLTAAIDLGISKLASARHARIIYIVTDGMPDDASTALASADKAKRQGIEIMTLGTDGANRDYLAKLASRHEFAVKVERAALQSGISSMARLLTDGK
jgi:Mg-chelatase subunit ChlD